jgi:predicted acylesterase/phospholipase RssA
MRLVLGGGGLKCLGYIGSYDVLEDNGTMERVDEVYGVSGGSIVGLGVALRVPPRDLLDVFRKNYPFKKDELRITHLISRFGLDMGLGGRRLIEGILEYAGIAKDAHMTALASLPIRFNVCVSNISTYEKQLITPDDDVSIVDAVMASSTIPILFVPVCMRGEYFIDGSALWHSFPGYLLEDGDIGMCQVSRVCREEKMTFWVYLSRLMTIFSMYFSSHDTEKRDARVVYFDDCSTKLVSYEPLTDAESDALFAFGRKNAEEYFQKQDNERRPVEESVSGNVDAVDSEE